MVAEVARTPAPGAPAPVRSLTVTVLGAGYVGLVSGACLAELGHHVTVTEIDERRLGALRSGMVPIRERGLDDIVDRQVAAGLLRFEDARTVDVTKSDVVMVAVGTPSQADGRVELGHVAAAVRQIARGNPRALVVIKSTVPPGTCDRMQALAHAEGGTGVRVVSNPEFLREGRAVQDFMQPDRVVIGARDAADAAIVEQLYAPLDASVLHCSPEEAELSM